MQAAGIGFTSHWLRNWRELFYNAKSRPLATCMGFLCIFENFFMVFVSTDDSNPEPIGGRIVSTNLKHDYDAS